MSLKPKELAPSDWTGGLSVIWIVSFLLMCAYSIWTVNLEMLEKIVALLGVPTLLVLRFYFEKTANGTIV